MDQTVTHLINSFAGSSSTMDLIMIAITSYGVPLLILLVILQWWSTDDRVHVRHGCVAAGLSFLLGLAANQVLLLFIHRIRPYDVDVSHLIIARSADWSFPSDHATASMAIVASLALARLPIRAVLFGILSLLVCASRIYVGTHFVSDVIGGAATGLIAAVIVHFAYREGSKADRLVTGLL
ncbi:MAG TPA: phosphatase PAP2 family protein [Kaistia sp.]|nr:phosphatase PAP2 family protein [Kaistia sp.]